MAWLHIDGAIRGKRGYRRLTLFFYGRPVWKLHCQEYASDDGRWGKGFLEVVWYLDGIGAAGRSVGVSKSHGYLISIQQADVGQAGNGSGYEKYERMTIDGQTASDSTSYVRVGELMWAQAPKYQSFGINV